MAKKKASKSEKKADLHDAGHEIETLRQENLDLKEDIAGLEEAIRRYERVYGSVPAIDAEAQAHGYSAMTALHQPIIVEEVAAIIPLLKDMNGNLMDEHNFTHQMAQSVGMAIKGVKMIREALAMQEEASPNDPDAEEELEG